MIKVYFRQFAVIASMGLLTIIPLHADDIHDMVKAGDVKAVNAAIVKDPTLLLARDNVGNTPLHKAAEAGNASLTALLIDTGADVNARNDRKRTPFWLAAWKNKDSKVMQLLSKAGADINASGFINMSPLDAALYNNIDEMIDFILGHGVNLPAEDNQRYTLMYRASTSGNFKVFKMMFDLVPTLDPKGEDAYGFLFGAASGGSADILNQLIATGIDPKHTNMYKIAPIHVTSANGFTEATMLLVEKGAALNARNALGQSPYNIAKAGGHSDLASKLLAAGAEKSPAQPPILEGDYLGEKLPNESPERFAIGIISTGGPQSVHSPPVFSKDGNEVYWSAAWEAPISYMKLFQIRGWGVP